MRWSLLLLLGRARGGRYSGGYYSGSSSKGYYSDSYSPIGFYDFKYSEGYYYSVVSKYDCSCSSSDDCFSGGYSVDGRCGCREHLGPDYVRPPRAPQMTKGRAFGVSCRRATHA